MSKFVADAPATLVDGLAHLPIKDTETGNLIGFARIFEREVPAFQAALASGVDLDTTVYDLDSLVKDQTPEQAPEEQA